MEVNDLLSTGVVGAVIVMILYSAIRRMLDLPRVPGLVWPVLFLAAAMPSYMAYVVLNPGEIYDKAEVRAFKDTFEVDIPAGEEDYALMVTALLAPEDEDEQTDKTAYTMRYELARRPAPSLV